MAREYVKPPILAEIRKALTQRYEAAIQAVALLERQLADETLDAGIAAQLASIYRLIEPAAAPPSIRQRVLAAIPADGATVEMICAATGLSKRQIRGVLYAPEIKGLTANHRASGQNRFYHRRNPITGEQPLP